MQVPKGSNRRRQDQPARESGGQPTATGDGTGACRSDADHQKRLPEHDSGNMAEMRRSPPDPRPTATQIGAVAVFRQGKSTSEAAAQV